MVGIERARAVAAPTTSDCNAPGFPAPPAAAFTEVPNAGTDLVRNRATIGCYHKAVGD